MSTRTTSGTTALFTVRDFGLTDYQSVWALQKALVQQRLADEIPDTLLIGEHPPVITLGRGSHRENLLNPTLPVLEIERGGDVTYHGPGQLVAYPIFRLPEGQRDLHRYLRNLEEVLILTLGQFGLMGVRNPEWTGVWVVPGNSSQTEPTLRKIASIGVAVRRWVTYHGLALNVSTDLSHFRQMNPCGLESHLMTSMVEVLNSASAPDIAEMATMPNVKEALIQGFQTVFYSEG
jgi:lipoyl(octanoyl) transferase